MALDHGRGREVFGCHALSVVALSLEGHLEASEVVEHHYLSLNQCFGDEVFDCLEDGCCVGFGDGCRGVDVACEVGEVVLAFLHRFARKVIHLGILGIAALGYFVRNWHRFNVLSDNLMYNLRIGGYLFVSSVREELSPSVRYVKKPFDLI